MAPGPAHRDERPARIDERPARGDDVLRPWSRSDRPIPRRVVRPIQAFLEQEAASGLLLVVAAILAVAWASSPLGDTYRSWWSTPLGIRFGDAAIEETLRGWVNDGLMSVFFLLVALEIKREIANGELRDPRAAALPVFGAIGGMLVPALVFVAIVGDAPGGRAWGAAMPTDIAFALGVLTLAAPGAPVAAKTFLLALAIVDDLGTIVVLALAYHQEPSWSALAVAAGVVAVAAVLVRIHVRAAWAYLLLAAALWVALHEASIGPALAGVVAGLLTPATAFQRPAAVSEAARRVADRTVDDPDPPDVDAPEWLSLASLSREAVPPLARIERAVFPWATWVVLPLFALANAGVDLHGRLASDAVGEPVTLGLLAARVIGKPVGIVAGVGLGLALGVARRSHALTWRAIVAVAAAAAVPFAVSLFVISTALGPGGVRELASIALLASTLVSGLVAFVVARALIGRRPLGG